MHTEPQNHLNGCRLAFWCGRILLLFNGLRKVVLFASFFTLLKMRNQQKAIFMSKLWFLFLLHSLAGSLRSKFRKRQKKKHSLKIVSIQNIFKSSQHLYSGNQMDSAMIILLVYFRCHHILIVVSCLLVWLINNILTLAISFIDLPTKYTDRYRWYSCHSCQILVNRRNF